VPALRVGGDDPDNTNAAARNLLLPDVRAIVRAEARWITSGNVAQRPPVSGVFGTNRRNGNTRELVAIAAENAAKHDDCRFNAAVDED
jgi:hypothetical protein